MSIISSLKYRFSEAYRIKTGRGLSPIRNKRELKALVYFCEKQLEDTEHMRLNPDRRRIYTATVYMYNTVGTQVMCNNKKYIDIYELIDDHVGYYWS